MEVEWCRSGVDWRSIGGRLEGDRKSIGNRSGVDRGRSGVDQGWIGDQSRVDRESTRGRTGVEWGPNGNRLVHCRWCRVRYPQGTAITWVASPLQILTIETEESDNLDFNNRDRSILTIETEVSYSRHEKILTIRNPRFLTSSSASAPS